MEKIRFGWVCHSDECIPYRQQLTEAHLKSTGRSDYNPGELIATTTYNGEFIAIFKVIKWTPNGVEFGILSEGLPTNIVASHIKETKWVWGNWVPESIKNR